MSICIPVIPLSLDVDAPDDDDDDAEAPPVIMM